MEPKNFKLVTTIFPIELAIWGLYHFWSEPHHVLKSKIYLQARAFTCISPPARQRSLDFNKGATPSFLLLRSFFFLLLLPSSRFFFLLPSSSPPPDPSHINSASSGCSGPRLGPNIECQIYARKIAK